MFNSATCFGVSVCFLFTDGTSCLNIGWRFLVSYELIRDACKHLGWLSTLLNLFMILMQQRMIQRSSYGQGFLCYSLTFEDNLETNNADARRKLMGEKGQKRDVFF